MREAPAVERQGRGTWVGGEGALRRQCWVQTGARRGLLERVQSGVQSGTPAGGGDQYGAGCSASG